MSQGSDDDEDDQDEEYRVFGRQTMKAQSEALYEVTRETVDTGIKKKQPAKKKSSAAPLAPSPIKE